MPQSYPMAAQWYLKAARQGLPERRSGSDNCTNWAREWAVALSWYEKSAARHDPEGSAIKWFQAAGQGNSQAAHFARWLRVPSNNIGFRDDQKQRLVIGGRLPFVIGSDDPAGITFHNSGERVNWLKNLRGQQVAGERRAMWQVRKNDYDKCMHEHGDSCHNPGPAPK